MGKKSTTDVILFVIIPLLRSRNGQFPQRFFFDHKGLSINYVVSVREGGRGSPKDDLYYIDPRHRRHSFWTGLHKRRHFKEGWVLKMGWITYRFGKKLFRAWFYFVKKPIVLQTFFRRRVTTFMDGPMAVSV